MKSSHLEDENSDDEVEVEALTSSAGIIAKATVGDDGILKVTFKGRPSGKMPDGTHGDHTMSQILSIHAIRRFGNGTQVSQIDDLRDVRENIFDFISGVAVLNSSRQTTSSESSEIEETGLNYLVKKDAIEALYARQDIILGNYNNKRYKEVELGILEKTLSSPEDISSLGLSRKETKTITETTGGIRGILRANIEKNRQSNKYLICETFEDLVAATSTYYYNIPNTSYPTIEGYEASSSEGGNVNVSLRRIDEICEKLAKEKSDINKSGRPKRSGTVKSLSDIVKESAQTDLTDKADELEKLTRKYPIASLERDIEITDNKKEKRKLEKLREKHTTLPIQIEKLSLCTAEGNDPLQYIALKLKDLFHYPEITDTTKIGATGRNNDKEEFYDKTAKHLFNAFNTYPELAENTEEKNRIVGLFLNEMINHTTNLGIAQGWPSLQENGTKDNQIGTHISEVLAMIEALNCAKEENLYTNSIGYRSRASSGAMENMKEQILTPITEFIRENFRLKDERFEGLVKQLNELDLTGKTNEEFKDEIFQETSDYCKKDRVNEKKINELGDLLLPSQLKKMEAEI